MKNQRILLVIFVVYFSSYLLTKSHICDVTNSKEYFVTLLRGSGFCVLLFPFFMRNSLNLAMKRHSILLKLNFVIIMATLVMFTLTSKLSFGNLYYAVSAPLVLSNIIIMSNILSIKFIHNIRKIFFLIFICITVINLIIGGDLTINYEYAERVRYVFGFVKPSYVSEIIIILLSLIIVEYLFYPLKKNKWLYIQLLILIPMLLSTGSKSSFLIIFLAIISNRYFKLKTPKFIFANIAIVLFLYYLLLTDFRFLFSDFDSGRYYIWSTTVIYNLKSSKDWLFGVGYGNAINFSEISRIEKDDVGNFFHIDSYYVELLIQQGILGIIFYSIAIYNFFIIYRSHITSYTLIIALLCYGFIESVILNMASPFGYVPWIAIAVMYRCHREKLMYKNK